MKKELGILSVFVLFSCFAFSQKKLYYFSGSDWCAPCIKFKSDFIDSKDFKGLVDSLEIDFEILDFPQRKKGVTKEYRKHCDSLAAIYNREGSFPKLISVAELGIHIFNHKSPASNLISELKENFPSKNEFLEESKLLMGSTFKLKVAGADLDSDSIFKTSWKLLMDIEEQISSWDSLSLTSTINRNAGLKSIKVPYEYFKLISYCKTISGTTQGAFDITVKPALNIWDWKKGQIPSDSLIESIKGDVGFEFIELNEKDTSVYLNKKGTKLDFGAIGKGYAADKLVKFWKDSFDLTDGLVDAGGDLVRLNNYDYLLVLIPNPKKPNSVKFELNVAFKSIVTSGEYYRSFEVDSVKYSHIIDPRTCKPTKSDLVSVTVFAPNGTMADALATAISVLGKEAGVNLVNQLPGVEAILISSSGGEFYSDGVWVAIE